MKFNFRSALVAIILCISVYTISVSMSISEAPMSEPDSDTPPLIINDLRDKPKRPRPGPIVVPLQDGRNLQGLESSVKSFTAAEVQYALATIPRRLQLFAKSHPIFVQIYMVEKSLINSLKLRPDVVVLGKLWIKKRDMETYRHAIRNSQLHLKTVASIVDLHVLSGILCMGIGDMDNDCLDGRDYPYLARHQKISRIHGLREILWKKDAFCNTMKSSLSDYEGSKSFLFPCWTLPTDYETIIADYAQSDALYRADANAISHLASPATDRKWIVKVVDHGGGRGIFVVDSLDQLAKYKNQTLIVQEYMLHPALINGFKFDLRTYVLITSVSPLRAYFFYEGLVRFASSAYNSSESGGGSQTQYLTNTSINKLFKNVNDLVWTFARLKAYLNEAGFGAQTVFDDIEEALVRTILAAEPSMRKHFRQMGPYYDCFQCYQVLGIDVILDQNMKPRVIEVNGSPSMELSHKNGSLYDAIKIELLSDVMKLLFHFQRSGQSLTMKLNAIGIDNILSAESCSDASAGASIKKCLNNRDLEALISLSRESSRQGKVGRLKRIYPTARGAIFDDLIRHVYQNVVNNNGTKLIDVGETGTYRLHSIQTEIAKIEEREAAELKEAEILLQNVTSSTSTGSSTPVNTDDDRDGDHEPPPALGTSTADTSDSHLHGHSTTGASADDQHEASVAGVNVNEMEPHADHPHGETNLEPEQLELELALRSSSSEPEVDLEESVHYEEPTDS